MHFDNRGLPLSTASAKAAAAFNHLITAPEPVVSASEMDLRPTSARPARFAPALYPAALFLSALLLFAIQPMLANMVLPRIGGAAAVWSVAIVFFQAALLLGYAYAHQLSRTLSPAPSALVHLGLLAVAATTLSIGIAQGFEAAPQGGLELWLLALFATSIGLPFVALAASAPLLQNWFAASHVWHKITWREGTAERLSSRFARVRPSGTSRSLACEQTYGNASQPSARVCWSSGISAGCCRNV